MAEGRMLKKIISTSRKLADLKTDSARLLYTWILPHLDIRGRFSAEPEVIRGYVVPRLQTMTVKKIGIYLQDMAENQLIILYKHNEDAYLQVEKFRDFQILREDREAASLIPPPDNSGSTPSELPANSALSKVKLSEDKEKVKQSKFQKPSLDELKQYSTEINYNLDCQSFLDFYESKGWVVGRSPMKDWKAAVRTWQKRDGENKVGHGLNPKANFGKRCYRCGGNIGEDGKVRLVMLWKENLPWCKLNCYDKWIGEGRPKYE